MIRSLKILPLILARGGTKGFPNKKIKKINGVSLVGRAIKTLISATGEAYYSSDAYFDEAKKYGAKIIRRPKRLCRSSTPAVEAVKHALRKFDADAVLLMNLCCPLTTKNDVLNALKLFKGADSVVSVLE